MIKRLYQIVFALPFLVVFATLFFPDLFPWSRRDFTIPIENEPELVEDRYGVWQKEIRVLLKDTTHFWVNKLSEEGINYTAPEMIVFFDGPPGMCGTDLRVAAPVYCTSTGQLYFDTGDYQGMSRQLGKRNHLAIAHSFAHQIGHHVQTLRGMPIQNVDESPNQHARRIELQADCYAGIYLRNTVGRFGKISSQDLWEIQGQFLQRHQDPTPDISGALIETWDYAGRDERTKWARTGFKSGELTDCEAISAE